ncbi:hypothetical protein, conserved [Eimeria tenella]|uniref:Uncharacterized protein n=1 Tax=Eimeria tenella TaxID=5802 RepID=U6L4B2_EIMTE|nr:hypothetical protein, conserved [Eimeria tenella]CDJ42615.1 hypothetical protein, conserved [Eimeria tenella]|eukprot:XP_013233365.1 hypothetical protein, conserved [Eimeria tenella]
MLADPKFTVIKIRCFTLISGVGLDRLPAGAVLLTLEVPSNIGSGQWNHAKKEGKKEEDPYTSQKNKAGALFHGLSATEGPSGNSSTEDLPLATAAKKISDGTEVSRVSSKNMDVLTGGNFTQAVALAAIEAADVLLISLLHEGRLFKPWSHDTQGVRPLGEFLCLGDTAVAGEDADMTAVPRQTSHSIRPSSANETEPANRQACLPEHISKLLYTMRQLLEENRVRRNGESGQFSTHPRDSSHQLALETGRPQRLPRVVILTEMPVSPSCEDAIAAEVRRHLGTADVKVSVIGLQLHGGGEATRDVLDSVLRGIVPRNTSQTQIADAIENLLTRQPDSAPPSSTEFAGCALACTTSAAAFRRSLAFVKGRLCELRYQAEQDIASKSFGATVQNILSEALALYDYQTRRCQLSPERETQRNELLRSLEKELRILYLRKALHIENSARLRLRAELVAALQKDARAFGSHTPGIVKKVLTAMDEQLTELLPPVAVKMAKKFKNAVSESQAVPGNSLWQPSLSDISEASVRSGRDAWLCHSLCTSLFDIHMLLLQKAARDFSAITLGFSRSTLASLLRQQQSRTWLGISLRPSLSIASLLRLRGSGNLQGYSRYNAGPIQLIFGFTNDGEGLERERQAAFRLQPKIHFDVEVD